MNYDPIEAWRGLRRRRGFYAPALAACLLVMAGSMAIYLREFGYENADMFIHATIASEFDFTDLHSITCRLSYPMWHLIVSALYQLGMPLGLAAAGVCALCKGLTFCFTHALVGAMAGEKASRRLVLGLSLFLMIVTGVLIPSVTDAVYRGVGSPTVWHNPTQQIVTTAMLLVMPWLAHCWYAFQGQIAQGRRRVTLPWRDIVVLAALCMGSVACKPTFMQALLPAAFVMFLVELIRRPGEWRYFGQIVLAFVPSVGYFLLSYLYYTGVVVEFTSGVEIGVTAESAWVAVRNTLMMSACPLAAVIACRRKGLFKDRLLVLALLMTLFSVLEAMAFRETGMREGHGNFTWAANSSSFFLWVVMAGVCLRCVQSDLEAGAITLRRKLGYAAVAGLFAWHAFSAVYYIWYLLTTTNAF
ncbi:MAG: hypothetical protein MR842_02165 [Clostridiales bacterium]|nr:hypothetical protein [Clostridiales bacterium]MDO4351067.1 hypothetical protein [Eubacteriales bacterium]MDY4008456.1 hypothetical protein [Candidatus Limiplasma sp.]